MWRAFSGEFIVERQSGCIYFSTTLCLNEAISIFRWLLYIEYSLSSNSRMHASTQIINVAYSVNRGLIVHNIFPCQLY